ncbi:hypothetical protein PMI35_02689 [Pseudomonas sp. GM78]|nr:hypothetical protein PMI35_02689 [Pseudomonas sp. GM78]
MGTYYVGLMHNQIESEKQKHFFTFGRLSIENTKAITDSKLSEPTPFESERIKSCQNKNYCAAAATRAPL